MAAVMRSQSFDVTGAANGIADRVQLQGQIAQPQRRVKAPEQRDDLNIERRILIPDRLTVELVVLPQTARLRPVVAEDADQAERAQRLGSGVHAVLQVSPDDRRGALGTKRYVAAALVGEGVHLLLDNIGRLTGAVVEERGVLKSRRAELEIAVQVGAPARSPLDKIPVRHVLGQDVLRPAGGLKHYDLFWIRLFLQIIGLFAAKRRAGGFRRELFRPPGGGSRRRSA